MSCFVLPFGTFRSNEMSIGTIQRILQDTLTQGDKSVFERYNVLITSSVVTLSRKITK